MQREEVPECITREIRFLSGLLTALKRRPEGTEGTRREVMNLINKLVALGVAVEENDCVPEEIAEITIEQEEVPMLQLHLFKAPEDGEWN